MAVEIHPLAVLEDGAEIGENVKVGPGCVVGANVKIGDGTHLISQVSVSGHTEIGSNCTIYPFAALGHPPQDVKYKGEDTKLFVGDDVTIREHVTMHTGTVVGRGETRVGNKGYFMVGSHIGHDCIVGDNVTFANNATLGGVVTVGDHVIMGGLSAVHQLCRVGRHAFIGGGAPVTGDVIPYGMVDNHGRLGGLNLVGLKRRGFSREQINDLRTAYRLFFASEGTFQERIDDAARLYADQELVVEMVQFIRDGANRHLCLPK
jgi:UDP-N-acetylglucosamine acyltransferase